MVDCTSDGALEHAIRTAWNVLQRDSQALPRIPGYEIERVLGRGGMGVVYLARSDRLPERPVALKVLGAPHASSPPARARFRREARALARLRHPGIVTIHDVIDDGDLPTYAMEWVEGPSLDKLISSLSSTEDDARSGTNSGRSDVEVGSPGSREFIAFAVQVGIDVARALSAVHSARLLHRDVKPSNVLLRRDGSALLSDFGLAREEDDPLWTKTGEFSGTLFYAPPEQLRGERQLDVRCDVYGLGCTLLHLIALVPPHRGSSVTQLLESIESSPRVTLHRSVPAVSRDLETVLLKATAADRRDRYESASALADDLARVQDGHPVQARRLGRGRRAWRFVRRRRRMLAAATVVAGIVGVLVALVMLNMLWVPGYVETQIHLARADLLNPGFLDISHALESERAQARDYTEHHVFQGDWSPLVRYPRALRAFDRALRLRPGNEAVRRERELASLALDLVSKRVPTRLPRSPVLRAYARSWRGLGTAPALDLEARIATASEDDLHQLGLLAYLAADPDTCAQAWDRLEEGRRVSPLVELARGEQFLDRGEYGRAIWRLENGHEAYPHLGYLAVHLADCALAVGDMGLAREVLARAARLDHHDRYHTLERVEADLALMEGRLELAKERSREVTALHRSPIARRHLAHALELTGSWEEAVAVYSPLLRPDWSAPTGTLRFATASEAWWASLSDAVRVEELAAALATPPTSGRFYAGLDERLLQARRHRDDSRAREENRDVFERRLAAHLSQTHPELLVSPPAPRPPRLAEMAASAELLALPQRLRTNLPAVLRRALARWALELDRVGALKGRSWEEDSDHIETLPLALGRVALPLLSAVVRWMRTGPSGRIHAVLDGEPDESGFGEALCPVDDLDGDGHGEIAVRSLDTEARGIVRALSVDGSRTFWTRRGSAPGMRLGSTITPLDDLDGDGLTDLLANEFGPEGGRVVVLSAADGHTLLSIEGDDPDGPPFGAVVASLPDFDEDGLRDIACTSANTHTSNDYGRSFVSVHSSADGRVLGRVDALWPGADLGCGITSPGDLDGDGQPDLVLSALGRRIPHAHCVAARTLAGRLLWSIPFHSPQQVGGRLLPFPDIDGDGKDEVLYFEHVWGLELTEILGLTGGADGRKRWSRTSAPGEYFGRLPALVPDLDGDGLNEVAVGICDARGQHRGRVSLLAGRNGDLLATIHGGSPGARFGSAVAILGDQDGDGLVELAVAAPSEDGTGDDVGSVWVFNGSRLLHPQGEREGPR